jgi:hypothetical protein
MAEQQKLTIKIPVQYTGPARRAIAKEVVDEIVRRTREDGRDKNNRPFAGYSQTYKNSRAFRIGGKTDSVDLTLTGEMMDSLKPLEDRKGEITIGFSGRDKELNGKVEGNRLGTYGQPKQIGPRRDFLGIPKKALKTILDRYPLDDREEMRRRIDATEAELE